MTTTPSYKPRNFPLSGLTGISDRTLEMHFETNLLTERLAELDRDGKAAKNSAYAEMKRHLSYEYGGMILHANVNRQEVGERLLRASRTAK